MKCLCIPAARSLSAQPCVCARTVVRASGSRLSARAHSANSSFCSNHVNRPQQTPSPPSTFNHPSQQRPSLSGPLLLLLASPQPYIPTRAPARDQRRYTSNSTHNVAQSGSAESRRHGSRLIILAGSVLAAVLLGSATRSNVTEAEAGIDTKPTSRQIRLYEIHSHGPTSKHPWIIHGTAVYDITDWVDAHPGGDIILRAAGDSIDPYWDIFSIHKNQDVYDILEQYNIGSVDPRDLEDGAVPTKNIADPFKDDPRRDSSLIVHTHRPCNAETPLASLASFLTPTDTFYVRNHMWVPRVDETNHALVIDLGDGSDAITYSMSDLKDKFKQHEITATLQCSGNRRSNMTKARKTDGLPWNVGAIGTAVWRGPKLRDVLKDCGLDIDDPGDSIKHAQFGGEDAYAASIPLQKALDPYGDVILAWEMNGKPLNRDHGYPIRVLAPGNVAARSVKWVSSITLSDEESTSQWQRRDYKCFGPNQTKDKVDWTSAPSIQEMPVQSAITTVERAKDGSVTSLRGHAFSGGGRRIARVDVSVDNGRTWDQAKLLHDDASGSKRWCWTLWRYDVAGAKADGNLIVKAVDEAYNTQPETHDATWNFRGNLPVAWHRLPVTDQSKADAEAKEQK